MAIDLIYCAAGNSRFAQIAIDAGFLYGAQLPSTVYFPPYFADQNWKNPNLDRYVAAIEQHRPVMASVLDWERAEQLPEVIAWAEMIAPFVQIIMIIPKVIGGVHQIPLSIGGNPVRLGYSVPTRHGGTFVPVWEFGNRPVHLLGGSPHEQRRLTRYLNVSSIDGNMHQMMAIKFNKFYSAGNANYAKDRFWPSLKEAGLYTDADAPYEAFWRSCKNIIEMWRRE